MQIAAEAVALRAVGSARDMSAAIVCHADRGVMLFWVVRFRQHERPQRARVVSARGLERATTHGANAGLTIEDFVTDARGTNMVFSMDTMAVFAVLLLGG